MNGSPNTSEYDLIIIDTSPVAKPAETLLLGQMVKNALVAVHSSVSFKEAVESETQEIKQVKLIIWVVIANNVELTKFYAYSYLDKIIIRVMMLNYLINVFQQTKGL